MDDSTLTLERFHELADAFGGALERWPATDRLGAASLVRAEPEATAAILREAAVLDRLLAASPEPAPSQGLREAIIAAAPRPRGRRMAGRRWVALGASLAAASVAGIVAGAAAAPIAASHIGMQVAADPAGDAARWLGEPVDVTEG